MMKKNTSILFPTTYEEKINNHNLILDMSVILENVMSKFHCIICSTSTSDSV